MALGLGLFALAMVIAVSLGWIAAHNSHQWNEATYVNLVDEYQRSHGNGNGNGSGKKR